jgi:transcriptional regulator with XRE-family HTH domain
MTPAELARRSKIPASTVSRYENGNMEATVSKLQSLAEALGISWAMFDDPDLNNIPLRRAISLDTLRLYAASVTMSADHRRRLQNLCSLNEAPTTMEEWTRFDVLRRGYDKQAQDQPSDETIAKHQFQLVRHEPDGSD